jgi:hypothetical protein
MVFGEAFFVVGLPPLCALRGLLLDWELLYPPFIEQSGARFTLLLLPAKAAVNFLELMH